MEEGVMCGICDAQGENTERLNADRALLENLFIDKRIIVK
jgi:hypothetical protein